MPGRHTSIRHRSAVSLSTCAQTSSAPPRRSLSSILTPRRDQWTPRLRGIRVAGLYFCGTLTPWNAADLSHRRVPIEFYKVIGSMDHRFRSLTSSDHTLMPAPSAGFCRMPVFECTSIDQDVADVAEILTGYRSVAQRTAKANMRDLTSFLRRWRITRAPTNSVFAIMAQHSFAGAAHPVRSTNDHEGNSALRTRKLRDT